MQRSSTMHEERTTKAFGALCVWFVVAQLTSCCGRCCLFFLAFRASLRPWCRVHHGFLLTCLPFLRSAISRLRRRPPSVPAAASAAAVRRRGSAVVAVHATDGVRVALFERVGSSVRACWRRVFRLHLCAFTRIYVCMYVCVCIYVGMYVGVYMCLHAWINVYDCMCVYYVGMNEWLCVTLMLV